MPSRSYSVIMVVGLGTLLSALGGNMVNLMLPVMSRDFSISIEDSRWVLQSFLLVVAVFLPVCGRLADILGYGWIYLAGYALMTGMAFACGMAGGFETLVIYRMVKGLRVAMMLATGPPLLITLYPANMRGRVLGILASATYIGLTLGPPIGGFIVSTLGWRWTFFLFVPPALLVLVLTVIFFPKPTRSKRASFDWNGTLLLLAGMPLLLFALSQGPIWGGYSFKTIGLTFLGLIGMVLFVWVEKRCVPRKEPLVDLTLFRSKTFSKSIICALANYIALFMLLILMPFYLEEGLGLQTSEVGLLLSLQPLVMAASTSPSGWLSDRIGVRGLATAGMLTLSGGFFGLSSLGAETHLAHVALWLAVIGLGTGVFISPNSSALMGAAPKNRQGTAGGLLAEARVVGMLCGVAVGTAVFWLAGGRTGAAWGAENFRGMQISMWCASAVALVGAMIAYLQRDR